MKYSATVEVWELINDVIPHFTECVIPYQLCD